ncbi:MAG: ABC transporter permease [Candidatus Nanopelagicaceae bacterium]
MHNSDFKKIESGLDNLELSESKSINYKERLFRLLSPFLAIIGFIIIWHLVVTFSDIESYILPAPSEVANSIGSQWDQGNLQEAVLRSFSRGMQGFLLAIAIATPIGIALGLNRYLRMVFGPILLGLQQLPSVAWVPAAIIWFGLSPATIYAVILLGAIPSIANGLIAGIDQIPPIYLKLSKVLRANRWQKIRHIILPAAWTGYLAGLEQGWAFAWRSLMAAELIAVSPALGIGIGQLLDVGRQLGDMSLVLTSIFMIMLIGIIVEKVFFSPLRSRTLSKRGLKSNV